jgi:hypothetical protein
LIKLDQAGGFAGMAKADWFQARRNNRH